MKGKVALLIGVILSFTACSKDYTYRIEGKLTNLNDSIVYAIFEREDYKLVDTIECEKPGRFIIEQSAEGFNSVTLYFENKSRWITLYLTPKGKYTVNGDIQYPLLLQVKGGEVNEKISAFRKQQSTLLKEYTDLTNELNKKHHSLEETDIASRISNINIQLNEKAIEYIKENPDKEESVVLIEMFFAEPEDTRRMDELLALLDPQLKNFYLARELEQYSTRVKRTALGEEAPGFEIKNIYGDTINLHSYSNKYLLLAFTAPWCDMCQTEDLFLDQIIKTYPKEQVDVVLISLDSHPDEVRNVLAKDSIQWNLVTDSAAQATMMLDLYNVNALPRCFLIDEEKKILLKTENGTEIKQTLELLLEEEEEEEEES